MPTLVRRTSPRPTTPVAEPGTERTQCDLTMFTRSVAGNSWGMASLSSVSNLVSESVKRCACACLHARARACAIHAWIYIRTSTAAGRRPDMHNDLHRHARWPAHWRAHMACIRACVKACVMQHIIPTGVHTDMLRTRITAYTTFIHNAVYKDMRMQASIFAHPTRPADTLSSRLTWCDACLPACAHARVHGCPGSPAAQKQIMCACGAMHACLRVRMPVCMDALDHQLRKSRSCVHACACLHAWCRTIDPCVRGIDRRCSCALARI